jgi:hypothetical protein
MIAAAMFLAPIALVYIALYPFVGHREKECESKCRALGHKGYTYEDFSGSYRHVQPDRCTCK